MRTVTEHELARVDGLAEQAGVSRNEMMRRLLAPSHERLSPSIAWDLGRQLDLS